MSDRADERMGSSRNNRFVNYAISELQEANRNPIYGYQDLPILSLEKAVKRLISIVPSMIDYVTHAKKNCNRTSDLLTWDCSAAVYLYSMPTPFFANLNKALRAENRHELKPWFPFLKLFMTALEKLPSLHIIVWRGTLGDVGSTFVDNHRETWWSVNSCSRALNVVEAYLGKTGTVFAIHTLHGKDISNYSTFPDEQEVILMPGTCVRVKSKSLNFENRLFIVHIEEEDRTCIATVPATLQEEIHVVLIGKTGNGKSSTGNSLLHSRSAFHAEQSAESITRNCEAKSSICTDVNGREKKLLVVDTPGFFDTNPVITNQMVQETITSQIFNMTSPGIHAFLIIVRVDRFTPEEKDTVEIIKTIFGTGADRYCIVVFTREDQLDEGQTIDKFINSSVSVQKLVHDCNNRRFSINNKLNGLALEKKTKELLQTIGNMVVENNGNYYTNAQYQQIEKRRKEKQARLEKKEQDRKKAYEEVLVAQVRAEERRKAESREQEIREDERRKIEQRIVKARNYQSEGFQNGSNRSVLDSDSSIQREASNMADLKQNNFSGNNYYDQNGDLFSNRQMPIPRDIIERQAEPRTNTYDYTETNNRTRSSDLMSRNYEDMTNAVSMNNFNQHRSNPPKHTTKSVTNS